ncbi:hypothetical protein QBC47DRAFT_361947 [Echria macrotheca]|uniref:DUF7791 domain-containing protein n=1 Tax=Echria macrotheca TaxID=438768 RepID=A0AAJ0BDM6_9PEZI|nr:hypothetical protein QBC47DRAFT_361947 [Echria macrotheca]
MATDVDFARGLLMNGADGQLDSVLKQCDAVKEKIIKRCAGIIDIEPEQHTEELPSNAIVGPESTVKFFHRSAHDFFLYTPAGQQILDHCTARRLDNQLVFASLARNWAFRYRMSRNGVLSAIPASGLHEFLVSVGMLHETYEPKDLDRMKNYCLERSSSRTAILPAELNGKVDPVIYQGLAILTLPWLRSWLNDLTFEQRVSVLHRTMLFWEKDNLPLYCEFLVWIRHQFFGSGNDRDQYTKVATARSLLPPYLSGFGPMEMSTFQYFVAGANRLVWSRFYSEVHGDCREAEGFKGRFQLWPWDFKWTDEVTGDKVYAFFFFDSDSLQSMAAGPLFSRLYPSQQDCEDAEFMILAKFDVDEGIAELGLRRCCEGEGPEGFVPPLERRRSLQIVALGHVQNQTGSGRRQWVARAVRPQYHQAIADAIYAIIAPSLFQEEMADDATLPTLSQIIARGSFSAPESMEDFLTKRGILKDNPGGDIDLIELQEEEDAMSVDDHM